MQLSSSIPLKFRIAAIVVSLVLALSLLELWAGGVRFMKLFGRIAGEIAQSSAAEEAAAARPKAPPETPGVVSVGIIPAPKSKP